ncbi:hypothetical protein JCM3765_004197 [Sporobolomyces pararoseus]
MTQPRRVFGLLQDRICFSFKTEEEPIKPRKEAEDEESPSGSGSQPASGSQSIPYYLTSSPESLNSQPRSIETRSSGSEFYKSMNRVFSSTHVRDPRFPETPPPHHTPDAIPRPRRHVIPPIDYIPYVRPAILNPYSDVYSPRQHYSAHLIYPMSSFVADLTLALEAIEEPVGPGEQRPLYGIHHSPPPEGQRDPSGLYRPLQTNPPTSSAESREGKSIASRMGGREGEETN